MQADVQFKSFWMGGLECSSHRLRSGQRLDMLQAARHDEFYEQDYARLRAQGFLTLRSGLRWHRIEQTPGHYDFSSALPLIHAAERQGMEIIWDVCHYGWPADLDIMSPAFIRRFAGFARAFARLLRDDTDSTPFLCPINEISFFSWGGGDVEYLNPFYRGRGFELKVQLARAAIEATEAIWSVLPDARIVHVDPIIHITPDSQRPRDAAEAEGYRQAQYQGWDLLSGRIWPQIGGDPKYLDILGANYYATNQWIHGGSVLDYRHPLYRPLRELLLEVYERYQRPLLIAETGAENEFRSEWLRYVSDEAAAALEMGIPLRGLCLYPIFNHPGWDDNRHCHNGLWDYADDHGHRPIYPPFAAEILRADDMIQQAQTAVNVNLARRADRLQSTLQGDQPPKICLFTDSLEASGMGEHILTLAETLHPAHAVTVVIPPSAANQTILHRAQRIGVRVLPLTVRGQDRAMWEALRDFLRAEQIDIFHAHAGIGWEGHDGVYAAWFARVPVVVRTEHLPYMLTDGTQQRAYAGLLHKIDQVICVSDESCQSYQAAGISPAQLRLIRNGVSVAPAQSTPALVRASLGIDPSAPFILTAGRITEQKGYRYLLEALPLILAQFPSARFVWAGDGPLYGELCTRLEHLDLTNQVRMLGWRDDLGDLMRAADLFVLPSLFEGLPLVVLEALALGTPVVATRVGGTPEAIHDGISGVLVPPGDSVALGAAICTALANPVRRRSWAEAGQARFAESFSAARMGAQTATLYRELLTHAARRQENLITA